MARTNETHANEAEANEAPAQGAQTRADMWYVRHVNKRNRLMAAANEAPTNESLAAKSAAQIKLVAYYDAKRLSAGEPCAPAYIAGAPDFALAYA